MGGLSIDEETARVLRDHAQAGDARGATKAEDEAVWNRRLGGDRRGARGRGLLLESGGGERGEG